MLGRMNLLCRIGLHKVEAVNEHVQRIEDGVWFDRTWNRCGRDSCPKSLWWRCYDVEVSPYQIPLGRDHSLYPPT
jgi:hypothetical protein